MGIAQRLRKISDSVLDKSIVFDFDRTGFERHARDFSESDLSCNLSGKTVAITGGTSGLGLATAKALNARRANLIFLCRHAVKAEQLLVDFRHPERARIELVDVAEFDSIDALGERLGDVRIDILIHSAGVLLDEHQLGPDGLEKTLATNLVGPFRLTYVLLPKLTDGARIVFVGSGGMYTQRLDLDVLEQGHAPFDGAVAYAQTKRALVMIADNLGRRLGANATVASMHPGWADTPGVEASLPRFYKATKKILRTPEQGADTIVWLAASKHPPETGGFYFDRELAPRHMSKRTETPELHEPLWNLVCKLSEVDASEMQHACENFRKRA